MPKRWVIGFDVSPLNMACAIYDRHLDTTEVLTFDRTQRPLVRANNVTVKIVAPWVGDGGALRWYHMATALFVNLVSRKWHARSLEFVIENYAFHAWHSNRVTQVAEVAGLIKFMVWQNFGTSTRPIAIRRIKLRFAGTGNANKVHMYNAWREKTQVDLLTWLNKGHPAL